MNNIHPDHGIVILAYKLASEGASTLKSRLRDFSAGYSDTFRNRFVVNKSTKNNYVPTLSNSWGTTSKYSNRTYINWGDSSLSNMTTEGFLLNSCQILNKNIGLYSDKKRFFRALEGYSFIPRFFTDQGTATQWLFDNPGSKLCIREKTQASGAQGLSIVDHCADVIPAPLYVEYKKKKHEFRYHFFRGTPGFLQQKRLRHGTEEKNFEIRNHANGWVFCRDAVDTIPVVLELCEKLKAIAVDDWGLDFGAFDIIYNQSENKAYVLEINTAPGLEGKTADDYARYFLSRHYEGVFSV